MAQNNANKLIIFIKDILRFRAYIFSIIEKIKKEKEHFKK